MFSWLWNVYVLKLTKCQWITLHYKNELSDGQRSQRNTNIQTQIIGTLINLNLNCEQSIPEWYEFYFYPQEISFILICISLISSHLLSTVLLLPLKFLDFDISVKHLYLSSVYFHELFHLLCNFETFDVG